MGEGEKVSRRKKKGGAGEADAGRMHAIIVSDERLMQIISNAREREK